MINMEKIKENLKLFLFYLFYPFSLCFNIISDFVKSFRNRSAYNRLSRYHQFDVEFESLIEAQNQEKELISRGKTEKHLDQVTIDTFLDVDEESASLISHKHAEDIHSDFEEHSFQNFVQPSDLTLISGLDDFLNSQQDKDSSHGQFHSQNFVSFDDFLNEQS